MYHPDHGHNNSAMGIFNAMLALIGWICSIFMKYLPTPEDFWPAIFTGICVTAAGFFTGKICRILWTVIVIAFNKLKSLWQ